MPALSVTKTLAAVLFSLALTACMQTPPKNSTEQTGRQTGRHMMGKQTSAGWRCDTPARGSGIVAGFFRAWHDTSIQDSVNDMAPLEQYRCFRTVADCQSWMQKLINANNNKKPEVQICKKF